MVVRLRGRGGHPPRVVEGDTSLQVDPPLVVCNTLPLFPHTHASVTLRACVRAAEDLVRTK
eukprot:3572331-Pyramimonas_sp.AAC.1